jgi:LemA protein
MESMTNPGAPAKLIRPWMWVVGILGLLFIGGCSMASCAIGMNDTMVGLKVEVEKSWGNVQNQYQVRFDLIPNLADAVTRGLGHENETLKEVMQARAAMTQIKLTAEDLEDPEKVEKYRKSMGDFERTFSKLLSVVENYPQLRGNELVQQYMNDLAGTERRIGTERTRYNDAVGNYNGYIQKFFPSIIAGFKGYRPLPQFKAEDDAQKAPKDLFKKG